MAATVTEQHLAVPARQAQKDRWREVRDPQDELVFVTVYRRGAVESGAPARSLTE